MQEKWKEIAGFTYYEVSNHGRVRRTGTNAILQDHPTNGGFRKVYITTEFDHNDDDYPTKVIYIGYTHEFRVDELVAEAFVRGKGPGARVVHIDGDKLNNNAWNLIWGSYQSTNQQVRQGKLIRIRETGDVFPNQRVCAEAIGGRVAGINDVLRGRRKHYMGYSFEYV